MKMSRVELIGKLQKMIAAREESAVVRKREAYDKAVKAETEYVERTSQAWSEARRG